MNTLRITRVVTLKKGCFPKYRPRKSLTENAGGEIEVECFILDKTRVAVLSQLGGYTSHTVFIDGIFQGSWIRTELDNGQVFDTPERNLPSQALSGETRIYRERIG